MKREVKRPTPLNINLKEIRESKGVTQKEVALALGMKDNRMINWYENTGAMPPYEKLVALAEFYNVSLDELFGRDVYNTQETIIYKNNNNVISNITSEDKPRVKGFYIAGDTLNRHRINTLITMIENPTFIDNMAEIIEAAKGVK